MTIEEMHIDFKRKYNKVDSEKYRNFRPEEIDLYLNEAQELLIKSKVKGFEASQKLIDDLRPLLVKHEEDAAQPLATPTVQGNAYIFDLSTLGTVDNRLKYLYHMRSVVNATKTGCNTEELICRIVQTDDLSEALVSEFYSPSFEWREVPILFAGDKVYVYSDGTFTIDELKIDYLKRPVRMANPNAVKNSAGTIIGYNHPDGTPAVQQDCEIQSTFFCREIVDEAIRIATIDLGDPRLQMANIKTQINK